MSDQVQSPRAEALLKNVDFLKLWGGQGVSQVGSGISSLAVPLLAIQLLNVDAFHMGLLKAVQELPVLVFGLVIGVWVDRFRRRPLLIGSDLGRGLLLAAIAAAGALGVLRFEALLLAVFLIGCLRLVYETANVSFLLTVVSRTDLIEANGKLEATRRFTLTTGPGLAGAIIQALSAPIAIVLDVASFVVSATAVALIRSPEAAASRPKRTNTWEEARQGLSFLLGHHLLRPLAGCAATVNLFNNVRFAVALLFLTTQLGQGAFAIGLLLAANGSASVLGAVVARRATTRAGLGSAMTVAILVMGAGVLLIPLAGSVPFPLPLLIAGEALSGLGITVFNVNYLSVRQLVTPDDLLGRTTATLRFFIWGTIPIGAMTGGILGSSFGLPATLFVAGLGVCASSLWLVTSRVRFLTPRLSLEQVAFT